MCEQVQNALAFQRFPQLRIAVFSRRGKQKTNFEKKKEMSAKLWKEKENMKWPGTSTDVFANLKRKIHFRNFKQIICHFPVAGDVIYIEAHFTSFILEKRNEAIRSGF